MVSPRYSRSSQKFGIIVVIFYRKKSKLKLTKKKENHSSKINASDGLLGCSGPAEEHPQIDQPSR